MGVRLSLSRNPGPRINSLVIGHGVWEKRKHTLKNTSNRYIHEYSFRAEADNPL